MGFDGAGSFARKLAAMFKLFLSSAEVDASLARLVSRRRVEAVKVGSAAYHVWVARD